MQAHKPAVAALFLAAVVACVPSKDDLVADKLSPQGRAVMAQKDALQEKLNVDLRSATALDGINTNVLRLDLRSSDKTLEERTVTAQKVARLLKEANALPPNHYRIAFDFPVSFQVGCAPISLYERVQLETTKFRPIQTLPAQRVLAYDQSIRGTVGEVLLDDAQWNVPFFVQVDRVEVASDVMGVAAKPDELFVSVHVLWTNIGTGTATMRDDPWRLVDGSGPREGQQLAVLDGGSTHLARNGGLVKIPPVEPGVTRERWYVFRVSKERLAQGSIQFARQRFAKQSTTEKAWQKAGLEVAITLKNGFPLGQQPQPGQPLVMTAEDWRGQPILDATVPN